LIRSPGVGHFFFYHDSNSWNEFRAWSHAAGLEVPAHERERERRYARAHESWPSDSVFLHAVG
jgi:hypothetical protein